MHSHLTFIIDGKLTNIEPDASINLNIQNPYFNSIEAFSYPLEIPLDGNRHLIGNVDDPASDNKPANLDNKQASIKVDGIPIASGVVISDNDYEVKDAVSVNINSMKKSLSDMISGLNCCDVELIDDDIVVGEKVGQVKLTGQMSINVKTSVIDYEFVGGNPHEGGGGYKRRADRTTTETMVTNVDVRLDIPAIGFSYPAKCVEVSGSVGIAEIESTKKYSDPDCLVNVPRIAVSYINTSMPFDDDHPYCNARICYKHYGLEDKDGEMTTSSEITTKKETENEAMWPYWVLDANRTQSGICFYVLYFLRCLFKHLGIAYDDTELMKVEDMRRLAFFTTKCAFYERTLVADNFNGSKEQFIENVNQWAESRGLGGSIDIETTLKETNRTVDREGHGGDYEAITTTYTINEGASNLLFSADLNEMIATRDNFPEDPVSSVIESLENSFGVRFVFDKYGTSCKAVFIRDLFRKPQPPIPFMGDILSVNKVTNKTTGVRVCYDAELDLKEQKEIVQKGVRKYDTDYNYIDYPPENQNVGDVSGKPQTLTSKVYREFFDKLSSSDMTTYVDKTTGNAYRIKVDGDAKEANEWHPVLFEVGGYKGVEIGDCSENNKENIIELTSHFSPVVFNDVNYWEETKQENPQSLFAAFVDEDMEHEFVEGVLMSVVDFKYGKIQLKAKLKTIESYDPTNTEDGSSPLQHINWGLAVAMMRGGGSDARILDYDFGYDGFGNDRWVVTSGKDYQMFNDTMDNFGGKFDYNGDGEGLGGGERFSLKMRAYKQPDWADAPLFNGSIADKNRGLFDTFMSQYAHFLLNKKPLKITALCTAAQIADIQNHWDRLFNFDGHIGFIDKCSCGITDENGVGEVVFDFLSF